MGKRGCIAWRCGAFLILLVIFLLTAGCGGRSVAQFSQ